MDFFGFLQKSFGLNLTDQQKEAIKAEDRRILLEACPGSGKTTTLVARIAWLILNKKTEPSSMLTLTFSRAAARDMERRFNTLFGHWITSPVSFFTIHSFCYRFLIYCKNRGIQHVPALLEKEEKIGKSKILQTLYFEIHHEYLSEEEAEDLSNAISFVKNKMINPEEYKTPFPAFSDIYHRYEAYKNRKNLMDFDDLLVMTYEVLRRDKAVLKGYGEFRQVQVDEVQDTSLIQHKIIEILSRDGNLFMVGDTDQSIYGFRGAEPEYAVNIRQVFPDTKVLKLEKNYRSSGCIVRFSNRFIRQNALRHTKNMLTDNPEGERPGIIFPKDREEQIQQVKQLLIKDPQKSTAVLFRNNLSGLPVAYEFLKENIPFYIRDRAVDFFRHFVISDIFAFFKLAEDLFDFDSFSKVYYKMGAGFSKSDLQQVRAGLGSGKDILAILFDIHFKRQHRLDQVTRIGKALKRIRKAAPEKALEIIEKDLHYREFLKRNRGYSRVFFTVKYLARGAKTKEEIVKRLNDLKKGIEESQSRYDTAAIQLLTLHGSKGMEFDRVVLIDLIEGQFPSGKSIEALSAGNRKDYEEESRLFYVGVTRAAKEVYLSAPLSDEENPAVPSRFIVRFLNDGTEAFKAGQRVIHKRFGEGIVKSRNEDGIEILFNGYGCKKIPLKTCFNGRRIRVAEAE